MRKQGNLEQDAMRKKTLRGPKQLLEIQKLVAEISFSIVESKACNISNGSFVFFFFLLKRHV